MMKPGTRAVPWTLGLVLLGSWACNSGSSDCPIGTESCPCDAEASCDEGLVCASKRCVDADAFPTTGGEPASGGSSGGSGPASGGGSGGSSSNPSGSGGAGGGSGGGPAPGSGGASSSGGAGGGGGSPSRTTSDSSGGALGGNGGTTPQLTATTTAGGSGGSSNPIPSGAELAAQCQSDDDCDSGLICVTADSSSLLVGGPAHGMCTQVCDGDCGTSAVCLSFASESFCMPRCSLGNGQQDCAARPDMACDLLPAPTGTSCTQPSDCGAASQVCLDGACVVGVELCLPKCGAAADCPDGRFCDPKTGECIDAAPSGKGIGEACDTGVADDCRGFCLEDTNRCLETCSLGSYPSCGSSSPDAGTADCLAPLYSAGADLGDAGVCYALCDCTSDCASGLSCISFQTPGVDLTNRQGRPGFCDVEVSGDVLLTCSSN